MMDSGDVIVSEMEKCDIFIHIIVYISKQSSVSTHYIYSIIASFLI